ncbi:MAG: chemotaxis protein CheB [Bacteriovoracia bacterium]
MLIPAEIGKQIDFVAIGCSAGGFDALRMILPKLPADFDKAVVVLIHLSPDRESLVAQNFQGRCLIPVKEAEDKEVIAGGNIYIAPPNYHLLAEPGGSFSLSVDEPENCSRPSIDVLMDTAAHVYGPRMIGVLLTGANADGARGLAKVKELGGIAVVEDPATAMYPQMPGAGLEVARPQLVMPVAMIADWLAALAKKEGK